MLHETRCRIAFACGVLALAAPCIIMFACDSDPAVSKLIMSWTMASLNFILCVVTITLVLTVADNFGLRVELAVIAFSVSGAVVLDLITIARDGPLVAYVNEFAILACHVLVYNITITVPVVRSFMSRPKSKLSLVDRMRSRAQMSAVNVKKPKGSKVAPASSHFSLGTVAESAANILSPTALPQELALKDVFGSDTLLALFRRYLVKDFRVRHRREFRTWHCS